MKELHIDVRNKIATYNTRGGAIVCGNKDHYRIRFTFDHEWDEFSAKQARFIWNDKYLDVVFTGDTVTIPILSRATSLTVGVYAGENLRTTTSATIPCLFSILCESGNAQEADYYEAAGTLQFRLPPIRDPEDNGKLLQTDNGQYVLKKADEFSLSDADKTEIAEQAADMVAFVQDEEPEDAPDGSIWIDTDAESDFVPQSVICSINNGIEVIDKGLTYARGILELRKIGSVLWLCDSGVYNFTDSFATAKNRTVHQFNLPKALSNKLPNVNGVYGGTGTIGYFPALAYENVTYTTFNCQSYLKRSAIGEEYDTYQVVYTGLSAVSGGGLCGFHLKMPLILIDEG